MSETRDARWSEADAELPNELSELLRAGREQLGTSSEVAELSRRLSAVLGPAAGLPSADEPSLAEPATNGGEVSTAAARGTARAPTLGAARGGIWAASGVGAAVAIGVAAFVFVRSSSSPVPAEPLVGPGAATRQDTLGTPGDAAGGAPSEASTPAPILTPVTATPPAPEAKSVDAAQRRAAVRVPGARADGGSAAETALLEKARAALQSRPGEALELTRRHRARFPKGLLAQEREVIAIEALERLGRKDAADARAAEFERRYRGSVHRPRLRRGTDTPAPAGGSSGSAPP